MKYAVLTGDVINFTSLSATKREVLIADTGKLLKQWVSKPGYAEIFRGDSFQLLFDDIPLALKRALQLRCWFKMRSPGQQKKGIDTRLSIGIGAVSYFGDTVLNSDGEAFHLSGRNFDNMKDDGQHISIVTNNAAKNSQIDHMLSLADILITAWTINQAEVIFLLLEGNTQQQIADELNIGQSAVNNRIKLARWKEIDRAMQYIASLITN